MTTVRTAAFASVFLLAFLLAVPGTEGAPEGLLDGKVLLVEKGETGKPSDGKDTYIFRNGKFRARHYEREYGFEEGAYRATKEDDVLAFTADLRSRVHGTIRFEGEIRHDRVEARYTWSGRRPKWYQADRGPTGHWARSVTTWPTDDPGPPGDGPPSHALDGRTFLVQSGEQGKQASHHDDYLIFRDGSFVSSDCAELLDFRESTYSVTEEGGETRFRAESTSPTHGTMIWDGIVRGDVMDATARWIDKRWYWTIDRMYWFRGQRFE